MLSKIEMENFKSFKKPTTIDFRSTNYRILRDTNVSENGILKGSIFVGANASGKTNIILSLKLLLELLFAEKIINIGLYKCLFSESNNIKLNYEFKIEDNIINYNINYDVENRLMTEDLLLNDKIMLNRIGQSAKSYITDNKVFTDIDKESLLLRSIYFNTKFNNYPVLKTWFNYLINSVYLDAFLRRGINPSHSKLDLVEYLKNSGVDDINNFFKKYNFGQLVEYSNTSVGKLISIDTSGDKSIFFKRDEIGEPIPFAMESLGNKNLLNMLPAFFHVIKNGGMLIIDEFSSAFHNDLEELLIRYFMEKSSNSQVFVVSHSTNLLSNTIFRPDQEYAVEFRGSDGSIINRFSNEKPREAQNIEKMYVSGVFGGKPVYEDE
ncbi:ATP-binding protein [Clostridium tyrobutyricum]|uniref:AAA family ATPase n=1 Tax=Clostridium tyrobutyricum TaxID=1519 RepID=UPI001C391000|nr:AAA family ATPase [Clostridium tyrobutyricum]MBV4420555.1 ATP-binding protein [Clostridium tyrobutyricum]